MLHPRKIDHVLSIHFSAYFAVIERYLREERIPHRSLVLIWDGMVSKV